MAKKDLDTLIRLRKWEVDERQRAMAQLLRREEGILAGIDALVREKAEEAAFVAQSGVAEGLTFAAYLEHWKVRRSQFQAALEAVRHEIEQARDELSAAYRRLKTFEITKQQRDEREMAEEKRLDQIELDEIGLDRHRRRQDARLI